MTAEHEAVASVAEPEAAVVAVVFVAEPEAVGSVAASVAEPEVVVSAAEAVGSAGGLAAVVRAAEPQVFDDIVPVSNSSGPVSVREVKADTPQHPRLFAVASSCYCSRNPTSVEVASQGSARGPTGILASDRPCNIPSSSDPRHNRTLASVDNRPSPGRSTGTDTSDPPTNATTSHPRKKGLCRCREQHTHRPYRARLSPLEARETRQAAGDLC